jgi:hypothetical protein
MNEAVLRIALPVAALALGALAVLALLDRMAADDRADTRRALYTRDAALDGAALTPGSALACLDGGVGEAAENACERVVFATPQSAGAAVAYVGARLNLLRDAAVLAQDGDDSAAKAFAGVRHALALDRYGVVAHVLATRDGCTAERCDAFALFENAAALKANLKAQVFDQYVSRYASAWTGPGSPMPASLPTLPQIPTATVAPTGKQHHVSGQWDFPSAASIPPVSIMNPEPGTSSGPSPREAATAPATPPVPPARSAAPRSRGAATAPAPMQLAPGERR